MDGVVAVNSAANQIAGLKGVAQSNSAFNAEQAKLQRDWTESMTAKQMEFNSRKLPRIATGKSFCLILLINVRSLTLKLPV